MSLSSYFLYLQTVSLPPNVRIAVNQCVYMHLSVPVMIGFYLCACKHHILKPEIRNRDKQVSWIYATWRTPKETVACTRLIPVSHR